MATKDEDFLRRLQATFSAEAEEHLQAISAGLLDLEKSPSPARQQEIIEAVFREAHSLKGAARAVGIMDIESFCQPLESVFSAWKHGNIAASRALHDLVHHAVAGVRTLLTESKAGRTAAARSTLEPLALRLEAAAKGEDISGASAAPLKSDDQAARPEAAAAASLQKPMSADTIRVSTWKLDSLYRQAEEIFSVKLAAEQRGAELREIASAALNHKKASENIRARLTTLKSAPGSGGKNNGQQYGAAAMAALLELVDKNSADFFTMSRGLADVAATAERDRRALAKMVDNLLDDAKRLLMLPFSVLLEGFPKLVRDLANDEGKEVDLVIRGAEIEIDRRIQEEMKDPLIHLVRNCVDHGIEAPSERTRQGKPARGVVTITVSHKAPGKAELTISDDGRGIDPARVLSAAGKTGVVSPEESAGLSAQETMELVFRSGVSTSPIVTDVSGRGLGLAIAQEKVERLGGTVSLESRVGTGTTFHIVLPLTLAAFRGVVVRTGGQPFVLPTTSVERAGRIKLEDIKTVEGKETVRIGGQILSLVHLDAVLGLSPSKSATNNAHQQVIVLASSGERVAFAVDEIIGEQEIVLKRLGKQLSRVQNIAGATVLGTGTLAPVLNVFDLMQSAISAAASAKAPARAEPGEVSAKSVLVAEDSIATRMLLKNILESSGYKVATAVDGLEALTALKSENFDLLVSDIEMPRMGGFELTAKIRADQALADLPVVLVTALGSREDREHGIDAGANAYIVKSSFDQSGLLDVIRRLV